MSTNPCDRMEAAWDPARRETARNELARSIDQHAPRAGRGTRKDARCQ